LLLVDSIEKVWIIYLITFLTAICNAIYSPARNSLMPSIVKKDNLLQINALEQVLLGIVSQTMLFLSYYKFHRLITFSFLYPLHSQRLIIDNL